MERFRHWFTLDQGGVGSTARFSSANETPLGSICFRFAMERPRHDGGLRLETRIPLMGNFDDQAAPRAAELGSLLHRAHRFAEEYATEVNERQVAPTPDAIAALQAFDEPLPEEGSAATDVLDLLHRVGSPATMAQTGGRYFGFVNGGLLPVGLAARWLGDTWDQNTAHYVMSPVSLRLEEVCERWLVDLLGLPDGTAAGFVTGTTLANLSGLAAARNELLRRGGWDVARQGLRGAPPIQVVAGADAHASVFRVVSLLGLGTECVELVPTDDQGRLALDQLPPFRAGVLVIAQAGNVNSGAFDPIGALSERAHAVDGWVHVDGAFGLWAGASKALESEFAGIETADSWAVDAHKTLNAPYDSGIVLCRDREALVSTFRGDPGGESYFQWSEHRDGMSYTPSMSRRARSIELWAVLKSLGRSGVEQLVDQLCANARWFAKRLLEEGFEIHNDVVFNQVLASVGDDDRTLAVRDRIQEEGECWCGGSTWKGRAVIRISVCSWATTRDDIERAVASFVAARDQPRPNTD